MDTNKNLSKNIIALILIAAGLMSFIFYSYIKNRESNLKDVATFEEAMSSNLDLWGEQAMAETNGPSYEFFAHLLPPPRYVNADFHYYPIVLSAPEAKVKARIISNGSGINIRGGAKSWRDVGIPFLFRVGPDEFLFGILPDRLSEPELAEGWLPIVEIMYKHRTPVKSEGIVPLNQEKQNSIPEIYGVEAFASTDSILSRSGLILVRFDLKQGIDGYISIEADTDHLPILKKGKLLNGEGKILAFFDRSWSQENHLIKASLSPEKSATMAIATIPMTDGVLFNMDSMTYNKQREICTKTWKSIIDKGMFIETPEKRVNDAAKNSICQIFQLINGDEIRYSSGNQYNKLYSAEGSDAAQALLFYGYKDVMRKLMGPLYNFRREGLELHQASFKINNLYQYYWLTRDKNSIEEFRPFWEPEIKMLDTGRKGENGLYPAEQYCGDIHTYVQSLNVNSKAWQALRNMGVLLNEAGRSKEAEHYLNEASSFREIVLNAVSKVVIHDTEPPFIPISLDGDEPIHDPILHSRIGSYWNIIIGYTIRSGIFPPGSPEEGWIPHYQEQHGGLCMGMVKSGGGQFNFWIGEQRVNPLYGTRYTLDALRRDDPDRALVSFYGMLAQGLTRNTFIGGEASTLEPVDSLGRIFYCPPNSASSAHLLSMLRNMLVQDCDLNGDGIPETLRMGFATSRSWLEDTKSVNVRNAPTAFGEVSFSIDSKLESDEVVVHFDPPPIQPEKTFLRIRLPDNAVLKSASAGSVPLEIDEKESVDISEIRELSTIIFKVKRN